VNPYVFIIGCSRSGTTLLRRMVDAHPRIAITRETHWIPKPVRQRTGLTADGRVTPELLPMLLAQPRFRHMGVEREDLERLLAGRLRPTYARFVTALFDLYGRSQGKALVGDKTPGYVREIPLLHALWPHARFVHLIRDGRDVCLSALNWTRKAADFRQRTPTWLDDPVTTAALWWRWNVLLGREAGDRLPAGRYCEMRYDALVDDPESASRQLCAFLDVPYDAAMLRFHEGRTRTDRGLSAKHAWLPPTPGLRDWRTELPADALAAIEAAAGDLLDDLGYARGAPSGTTERTRHGASVAARFAAGATARGEPLPEGW
jgi:Sulfotransferase family